MNRVARARLTRQSDIGVITTTAAMARQMLYASSTGRQPLQPASAALLQLLLCGDYIDDSTAIRVDAVRLLFDSGSTAYNNNNNDDEKALRETQTLRAGCSKAEPTIFAPPQTPSRGRGTAEI